MRLSFKRVTRCLLYSNLGMELPIGERREHAEVTWREGDGGACRLVQREIERERRVALQLCGLGWDREQRRCASGAAARGEEPRKKG